ncbi:MAG: hypothetical protein JRN20_04260 [Nitrososphaerota archaeon]|nr:hypothetical protein [Nitrososphaerota archaeon]
MSARRTAFWTHDAMCAEMDKLLAKVGAQHSLKQKAESICREGFVRDLERGRSMRSYIAAALYTALRASGDPMPLREFLSEIEADNKKGDQVAMYYRMFIRELDLILPPPDPSSYLQDIVHKLQMDDELYSGSKNLLANLPRCPPETCGKDPVAIAAGAIYLFALSSSQPLYERNVADACGISERRLRTCVKALRAVGHPHPASIN